MNDDLFVVKEGVGKIKDELFTMKERVALFEDGFDTHNWGMDTKWLMADLNALMVMLHATHSLCDDIINSDYFEGDYE